MNTGIGDAVNLAWKLAAVVEGKSADNILDTYESERILFARSLVATTDRLFQFIVNQRYGNHFLRMWVFPHFLKFATSFRGVRKLFFKRVSQVLINYRQSALSEGSAGGVRGGDRLPWVSMSSGSSEDAKDNLAPLRSLCWQVHVYGIMDPAFKSGLSALNIEHHEFVWGRNAEHAGLVRDAMYLVRPDGYLALVHMTQDNEVLRVYARRFALDFSPC